MGTKANLETEIKFRVEDSERILHELEKLGARKVSEGLEHNEVFDNGKIRKEGILLRLRSFCGKSFITFKIGVTKEDFKKAREIEVEVKNFSGVKKILEGLGYDVFWVYEKRRTNFSLYGVQVSLDVLPFGNFLEIEGSERGIRKAMGKLGLDHRDGITQTYLELYTRFCKENGEPIKNLVF